MSGADGGSASTAAEAPVLTVTAGNPTAEELAIVTAVLLRAGTAGVAGTAPADAAAPPSAATSGWAAYWRGLRPTLVPRQAGGVDWKGSTQPR